MIMTTTSSCRRVPKVELHCHFEGTVRPATFADLARKHGVALPTDDVDRLYDYDSIYEFLKIFAMVSSTLIDQEDFARAAYESIEDGVTLGNLRYREMFFNPTLHTKRGIPYADGRRRSRRRDPGRRGGLRRPLPADRRRLPPGHAGRGARDGRAGARAPARRGDRAGHGRRRGARPARAVRRRVPARRGAAGCASPRTRARTRPPANITTCLDLLGCERIDHGYHILGDEAVVARCRDEGITSPSARRRPRSVYFDPDDYTTHPIREMVAQGLKVMINSRRPVDVPHRHRHGVREDGRRRRVGRRTRCESSASTASTARGSRRTRSAAAAASSRPSSTGSRRSYRSPDRALAAER